MTDFPAPVEVLGACGCRSTFNHRSPPSAATSPAALRRCELARTATGRRTAHAGAGTTTEELNGCAHDMRKHPCHGCPDREEHARWAERHARLDATPTRCAAKVAGRTGSLARTFDQVCALLRTARLPDGDGRVTPDRPRMLARIWTESRPARRRVPAGRSLGPLDAGRAGRCRVHGAVRGAPRDRGARVGAVRGRSARRSRRRWRCGARSRPTRRRTGWS